MEVKYRFLKRNTYIIIFKRVPNIGHNFMDVQLISFAFIFCQVKPET